MMKVLIKKKVLTYEDMHKSNKIIIDVDNSNSSLEENSCYSDNELQ